MATAVYTAPWSLSAPPRVEVVAGLVRQDNFVRSRWFREDGLDDFKLSTVGGRQSKYSGRPAVAIHTQPINSDSLQVQVVEPVIFAP